MHNIAIYLDKTSSSDQLNKTHYSEYHTDKYRHKSEPVRDGIDTHMNSGKFMKTSVDRSKTHIRTLLSDVLNINSLDKYRPDNK